jgi:aryl-alcohol dehydrogenase-like predicted oxidoreductase
MEYIKLSDTIEKVSRIGLGSQPIGYHSKEQARETVREAMDNGINLIDTAPAYGLGRAEEILGEVLKEYDREEIVIASKTGLEPRGGRLVRNSSPQWIETEIKRSLERLQTDYIDIYQIHWPDPLVPIKETTKAMKELKMEGKIRAIGVSNCTVEQIRGFAQTVEIEALQNPYNIFEREIEEDVLPHSLREDITLIAYRPLCQGLLTGKLKEDVDYSKHVVKKDDPKYKQPRYGQYLEAVKKLDDLAQEKFDRSVMDLAIQWILDNKGTIALWGAWKPEYLKLVNEVIGWKIDEKTRKEIDNIVERTIKDPVGPEFLAPPTRQ